MGTINSARTLNLGGKLGGIERGRWADLFVVRGNLEDIATTRHLHIVMKTGALYDLQPS